MNLETIVRVYGVGADEESETIWIKWPAERNPRKEGEMKRGAVVRWLKKVKKKKKRKANAKVPSNMGYCMHCHHWRRTDPCRVCGKRTVPEKQFSPTPLSAKENRRLIDGALRRGSLFVSGGQFESNRNRH